MDNKTKYSLAGILVIFIIGAVCILVANWDSMFQYEINVTYPDGCIEQYNHGELISPVCEDGRILAEKIEQQRMDERQNKWEMPTIDPIER